MRPIATSSARASPPSGAGARRVSVLVIGGAGGLGAWLTRHLFLAEDGVDVTVVDIESPSELPENYAFYEIAYLEDEVRGLPALESFNLILVAVPRKKVAQVANRILSGAAPGTLVVDIVSLKEEPLAIIDSALPSDVGLIGTHPLFAPVVPSLVGQTVVICPTTRTSSKDPDLAWLSDLLVRHGATTPEMTASDHDKAMAIVQVLTHHTAWTVLSALKETTADFRHALTLLTPNFRALAGLVGRIADIPDSSDGAGARIFADIQTAGYADAQLLRDAFERSAVRLNKLAADGNHEAWAREAQDVARFFKSDVRESCKQLFAQSHASAQSDALALQDHRVAGAVCAFRSTTRGSVVAGRVVAFSETSVTIEICSASRTEGEEPNQRIVYALAVDDDSRAMAAALGFAVPGNRTETLPRGDYALLSFSEFETWKAESLVPHRRDLTLVIPNCMEGDLVTRNLTRLSEDILTSETISQYEPPDGSPARWTARLHIRGDRLPQRVLSDLQHSLSAFGVRVAGAGGTA